MQGLLDTCTEWQKSARKKQHHLPKYTNKEHTVTLSNLTTKASLQKQQWHASSHNINFHCYRRLLCTFVCVPSASDTTCCLQTQTLLSRTYVKPSLCLISLSIIWLILCLMCTWQECVHNSVSGRGSNSARSYERNICRLTTQET